MSAGEALYAVWVALILVAGFGFAGLVGALFLRGILGLWWMGFDRPDAKKNRGGER